MRIAIVGAGHIGGNIAQRLKLAGHHVTVSFARDQAALKAFANEIDAVFAAPADAVAAADVVVISVPWVALPLALEQAGPLRGKVVLDTTNHYGSGPAPAAGETAAAFNARRMPGARYTKSFNTLTSAFQASAASRPADRRVVQWYCGDEPAAKRIVAGLIEDSGYAAVDLGGPDDCTVMESPRRAGAVYGEEWRLPDAIEVVEAVHAGRAIPETPDYTG
jgi:hypothetical protein